MKKRWTAQRLFPSLLKSDKYICLIIDKKILLYIDNCSAHGAEKIRAALENIETFFLFACTTGKFQSLNTGIVAVLKSMFGVAFYLNVRKH